MCLHACVGVSICVFLYRFECVCVDVQVVMVSVGKSVSLIMLLTFRGGGGELFMFSAVLMRMFWVVDLTCLSIFMSIVFPFDLPFMLIVLPSILSFT